MRGSMASTHSAAGEVQGECGTARDPGREPPGRWLKLTGGFEAGLAEQEIQLPLGTQRLVAYLALADGWVPRARCAGALWEDEPHERAISNLRTTLWRLGRTWDSLVVRERGRLGLVEDVQVDIGEPHDLTRRLVEAATVRDCVAMARIVSVPVLLPSWADTWIVIERERLRLTWLQALELAASSLSSSQPDAALVAALAAVRIEPLQESAWRHVVSINLLQGNLASAQHAYDTYSNLLAKELQVKPSALMRELVEVAGLRRPTRG
jgi:DNA-binding SARP family transcriptional activator